MLNTTSGYENTAIGEYSLYSNTSGGENVAIGGTALRYNTTGGNNVAVGNASLNNNTIGEKNTAVGKSTMQNNLTGFYNTAIGNMSLFQNTDGYGNTSVGNYAMNNNTTGFHNTAIGDSAFTSGLTYSNSTAIGYNAQPSASNQVVIGDVNVTSTYLRGTINAAGTTIGTAAYALGITSGGNIVKTSSPDNTSRYVAYVSGNNNVEVLATGTGVEVTVDNVNEFTFSIPANVELISAKIRISGVSSVVLFMGTTDMDNTTFANRWMPIVQAWREDTGAESPISRQMDVLGTPNHQKCIISGLNSGTTSHIRLNF